MASSKRKENTILNAILVYQNTAGYLKKKMTSCYVYMYSDPEVGLGLSLYALYYEGAIPTGKIKKILPQKRVDFVALPCALLKVGIGRPQMAHLNTKIRGKLQ